jgi:hypothetical protein
VGQETQIDISTGSTYADRASTFQVANIPTGLSYESATKRILGANSSTNQSRWETTVTADNSNEYYGGGQSDPATIIFNITNRFPLFAAANSSILAGINRTFSAAFTISNLPTHSEVANLPAGITNRGITYNGNVATLTLSGYPTESVVARPLTLKVWNYKEPGNSNSEEQQAIFPITLHVSGSRPQTVSYSSPDNLVASNSLPPGGSPFIDVSSGVRVSAYGLPPGLSLDSITGKLSGTPTAAGNYNATVFIQNGKGWIKRTIVLNVR